MPGAPDISVTCEADAGEAHADFLEAILRRAWALIDAAPATLSVAMVGDETMSGLHERFLSVAGPTDVLTFELAHDAQGWPTEGEVVICLDEARRQAAVREVAVEHELLLYAIHGLLHLSGYDDREPDGHAAMHAREDEILRELGVGNVFDVEEAQA